MSIASVPDSERGGSGGESAIQFLVAVRTPSFRLLIHTESHPASSACSAPFAINNFKNNRKIDYKKPVKYVEEKNAFVATKPSELTPNGGTWRLPLPRAFLYAPRL
jgi:hypothetical protein